MSGIVVTIRRNEDGAVATMTMPMPFNEYDWAEGNYSCDCNRELFFCRACGKWDRDDPPCSDGRYSVRVACQETGAVQYDEIGLESE